MNRTKRLRNHLHLHHHHSHSKERTPLLTSSSNSARPSHIRFDSSSNPVLDTQEMPANRIPLLLDPEQVIMIHNLNQLPLEKVITFWPWCWNTHAMLVVRYVPRSTTSPSPFSSLPCFAWRLFPEAILHPWSKTDDQGGKEVQISRRRSEGSKELGRMDLGSRRRSCPFRQLGETVSD